MSYLSDKILEFNTHLKLELPNSIKDVEVLNPFEEGQNAEVMLIANKFYKKFYSDHHKRHLILGINPGRLGAGSTGIPFTDTKRLEEECGITVDFKLHEPSSVFVYDVIHAYGGVQSFYRDFYIGSVCPLGFVKKNKKGNWVNYNYYDDTLLQNEVESFIIESLEKQINFGLHQDKVFCLGMGKNFKYLTQLNKKKGYFGEVIPLEHPRYVMQYKSKSKDLYVDKFLNLLGPHF